jgi:acyl-CoA dehydrogenase
MIRVCRDAATPNASTVDVNGRFPAETVAALKNERLLSVLVPKENGGEGASLSQVADLCRMLAQCCGSSGMIYAMHTIKLHSLIKGGANSEWHLGLIKAVVADQLLIASATTEAGIGGDLRSSICCIMPAGEDILLRKEASVISYAKYADAIFATARRSESSPPSDQVMVALLKSQYTLEQTNNWDTLGMRGTRSEGFILSAQVPAAQVFPQPFAELAAQSMLATSHILWASVWLGIAQDAWARAQAMLRAASRARPNVLHPAATPLAEANIKLQQLRTAVLEGLDRFERTKTTPEMLEALSFSSELNNLKVTASRLASDVTLACLTICGIQGYKNDSPYSVGRNLRDVLSAPLMIANDRVVANLAAAIIILKPDRSLVE